MYRRTAARVLGHRSGVREGFKDACVLLDTLECHDCAVETDWAGSKCVDKAARLKGLEPSFVATYC